MTFDEMYDQMLNKEFSTRGRHAKADSLTDPAAAVAAVVASGDCANARHAMSGAPEADVVEAAPERERPTGLARYRTAALVGAGGLTCATIGAFLGGLGGYFTVSPAGAHAVASTSQDSPLADAINHVAHAAHSGNANAALAAATFSAVSGGLTKEWGAPSITTGYPSTLAVQGGPADGGPIIGGSGSGSGGTGTGGDTDSSNSGPNTGGGSTPGPGCTDQLTCLIDSLTGSLTGVGTLPGDPTGMLTGLLTEVTGALTDLGSLVAGSLPVATGGGGLPLNGLVPSSGLPGGLPVTADGPLSGSGSQGSPVPSGSGSVGTVVGAVTGALSAATGSGTPTAPSLPSSGGSTTPSQPVTGTTVPTAPTSSGSTTPTTSGSGSVTVTAPLPLPTTPPVTLGPVTVGTTSGSGSSTGGLTLNLGGL